CRRRRLEPRLGCRRSPSSTPALSLASALRPSVPFLKTFLPDSWTLARVAALRERGNPPQPDALPSARPSGIQSGPDDAHVVAAPNQRNRLRLEQPMARPSDSTVWPPDP